MRILGLHFGHDAGVALIEDGRVRFLAHSERLLRKKKPSGLTYSVIAGILDRAGLHPDQIDFCAITSTQGVDFVLDRRSPLQLELVRHPADTIPSRVEMAGKQQAADIALRRILDPTAPSKMNDIRRTRRLRHIIERLGIREEDAVLLPMLNRSFLNLNAPGARQTRLRDLSEGFPANIDANARYKFDFHYPATLTFADRVIPAALIGHHAAHAAATFYQSPSPHAAIMTLDGGRGAAEGGLFWLGQGNAIIPLRIHFLELGHIYLHMAHEILKLGGSAEGKMMGLAPYGAATLFQQRFVSTGGDETAGEAWIRHVVDNVSNGAVYRHADLGVADRMTTPINADIAASTQKLFEETMLEAIGQLEKGLAKMGTPLTDVCLSGGCMLNCPTNTRISQETSFKNVYVEPACDDGGLPAGAALWVYYNLMGHPRTPVDPVKAGVPYLGLPLKQSEFDDALSKYADRIVMTRLQDAPAEGAKRLVAGQVVGWFEGRSEIGPRALGHRSIVADPRGEGTWHRVNTIKGRELWRPLAPSVLEEHAHEWFSGLPTRSPFMMFVGEVIKPDVPAIRHVDGTARVQTVSPECGGYYKLIKNFHALTGCAVVLNTSMNGPGEPIAEYPADAIAMLLDGRFDALFLEGMLIERRKPAHDITRL